MTSEHRAAPAWIFAFAGVPDGLFRGFLTVAFPFIATQSGMSLATVGGIVALGLLAIPAKLLWMPLVDLSWSLRGWIVGGAVATALCMVALVLTPLTPSYAATLGIVAFVGTAMTTFCSIAGNALLALTLPSDRLSAAAGYVQAGNLGSAGLGGAAGLWLATNAGPTTAAAVMAAAVLTTIVLALLVAEPERAHFAESIPGRLREIVRDLWETASSRRGLFVLIAFLTPIGVGGASMLWAGVATEWHAGADTVAIVTGLGSGLATAAGAMAYGMLIGRMNRMDSFLLTGLLLVGAAILVAVLPRTPAMFAIGTTIYALLLGCSYTSFTALQYEVMGKGAAASKYCLLNAVGNVAVSYMPWLIGIVHDRSSSTGMLLFEAGFTPLFIVAIALLRGIGGWRVGSAQPATA